MNLCINLWINLGEALEVQVIDMIEDWITFLCGVVAIVCGIGAFYAGCRVIYLCLH